MLYRGVFYTGGSVNPARSFGPCVILGSFYSYHWIYWVGPILGSLVATGFYLLVKALEYETVNPEQDTDGELHAVAFDPSTGVEEKVIHRQTHLGAGGPLGRSGTNPLRRDEAPRLDSLRTVDVYQQSGSLESGRGLSPPIASEHLRAS
jgi:aquaporin related protein